MQILLLGDVHGDLAPAHRLLDERPVDLLLSPGDWGDPGSLSEDDWAALLARVPVLTVYGNHDDMDLLARLRNADGTPVLVPSGSAVEAYGLRVAGLSGIWAKSHRQPYYVTDEDADAMLARDVGPIDILLTHGCPLGVADMTAFHRHGGQRCFLRAFQAWKPRLHVCGHLHVRQSHRTKDGALVANPGDGRLGQHFWAEWEGGYVELEDG